ncbi:unnamed protein product, partial [Prorocentrum cordatum]
GGGTCRGSAPSHGTAGRRRPEPGGGGDRGCAHRLLPRGPRQAARVALLRPQGPPAQVGSAVQAAARCSRERRRRRERMGRHRHHQGGCGPPRTADPGGSEAHTGQRGARDALAAECARLLCPRAGLGPVPGPPDLRRRRWLDPDMEHADVRVRTGAGRAAERALRAGPDRGAGQRPQQRRGDAVGHGGPWAPQDRDAPGPPRSGVRPGHAAVRGAGHRRRGHPGVRARRAGPLRPGLHGRRGGALHVHRARRRRRHSDHHGQHERADDGLGHRRRLGGGGPLQGPLALDLGDLLRAGREDVRERKRGPHAPHLESAELAVRQHSQGPHRLGRGPVLRARLVAILQHRPDGAGVGRQDMDVRACLRRPAVRSVLRLRFRGRAICHRGGGAEMSIVVYGANEASDGPVWTGGVGEQDQVWNQQDKSDRQRRQDLIAQSSLDMTMSGMRDMIDQQFHGGAPPSGGQPRSAPAAAQPQGGSRGRPAADRSVSPMASRKAPAGMPATPPRSKSPGGVLGGIGEALGSVARALSPRRQGPEEVDLDFDTAKAVPRTSAAAAAAARSPAEASAQGTAGFGGGDSPAPQQQFSPPPRPPAPAFAAGGRAQVFSATLNTWLLARVTKVDGCMVTVVYNFPDGGEATKALPSDHQHIRPAEEGAPLESPPPGAMAFGHQKTVKSKATYVTGGEAEVYSSTQGWESSAERARLLREAQALRGPPALRVGGASSSGCRGAVLTGPKIDMGSHQCRIAGSGRRPPRSRTAR